MSLGPDMKRWITTAGIVAGLAALATTSQRWLPYLLKLVGTHSNLIQGLDSLVQLAIWVTAGLVFLIRLWGSQKVRLPEPEGPEKPPMVIANHSGVAVGGDISHSIIVTHDGLSLEEITHALRGELSPETSPAQVYHACKTQTESLANGIIGDKPVVDRPEVTCQLDKFVSSHSRCCLLIGPSGGGKSIIMAQYSQRLLEAGWSALLLRGRSFSLEYLAEILAQGGPGRSSTPNWRHVVVAPWRGTLPTELRGFILLIDGLDEIGPSELACEMDKLEDATGELPADRFKIVVSCRDLTWERLRHRLPLWKSTGDFGQRTGRVMNPGPLTDSSGYLSVAEPVTPTCVLVPVSDFSDGELNRALESIGASELLTATRSGEWVDPHVESMRDLLKHPANFGLYAELYSSGSRSVGQNVTWSWLIEQHLQDALEKAGDRCGVNPGALRVSLIKLVELCRRQKPGDLRIQIDSVIQSLPDLGFNKLDPAESPYSALKEAGVLTESATRAGMRFVSFRFPETGGYLLSLTLEREAEGKGPDAFRELCVNWLREAEEYPPIMDAILAWADRLAETPRNPNLRVLIETLLESHSYRIDIIFRLMPPAVIATLLEAAHQCEPQYDYRWRSAAEAVRPSLESLEEIRRQLNDHSPEARRLAAQLVGQHRNSQAIPCLVDLLEDEDDGVRGAVYVALSCIGTDAIAPLVEIVRDDSQRLERRVRGLIALRVIGIRNNEVLAGIRSILGATHGTSTELIHNGLLTAAHLRDVEQTRHAINGLQSEDWKVVLAAAKYLTEIRTVESFTHLEASVTNWRSPVGDTSVRTMVLRQILAALIKTGHDRARELVLEVLRDSLGGNASLPPVMAVWTADDLNVPAARGLLLEDMMRRVVQHPADSLVWQEVTRLSQTWWPSHLEVLAERIAQLTNQGVEVAQRISGAIVDGIHADYDHPLRDDNAQLDALRTLAKCSTRNFGAEASRLLEYSQWSLTLGLCEMLWVAADTQAEEGLLRKLHSSSEQQGSMVRLEKGYIIRALGMCGREDGAKAVLDYLRSESKITASMPEEAVCPLVRRGLLTPLELVEVARDSAVPRAGRIASLIALGNLDAKAHKGLFRRIVTGTEGCLL